MSIMPIIGLNNQLHTLVSAAQDLTDHYLAHSQNSETGGTQADACMCHFLST